VKRRMEVEPRRRRKRSRVIKEEENAINVGKT
jgi:hypothetical protein